MNCERARDVFSDYLEGNLDLALATTVRGHIDECASCKNEYNLFRQSWHALGCLPEVKPPASMRHDVIMRMAHLQHEERQESRLGFPVNAGSILRRLYPARAIAVACVATIMALVLLRVPESTYDVFTGWLNPGITTGMEVPKQTAKISEGLWGSKLDRIAQEWRERRADRNSIWTTVKRRDVIGEGGFNQTYYQVELSINQDALAEGVICARIDAAVYLLPPNQWHIDDMSAVQPIWRGDVLKGPPTLVSTVIGNQTENRAPSVNLLVTWRYRDNDYAQIVFIPTQGDNGFASNSAFGIPMANASHSRDSVYSMLQSFSTRFDVPVVSIASSRLAERLTVMDLGESNPERVLGNALEPLKLGWVYADNVVYVDRN